MFQRRTLLIVGAGASVEAGFPTGIALKDRIREALSFESEGWDFTGGAADIRRTFQISASQQSFSLNDLLSASDHIARNLPLAESIDSFLHSHQGDRAVEFAAKVAVAEIISRYETASSLYLNHDEEARAFDFGVLKDTWYVRLWSHLHRYLNNTGPESVFENLDVITFNYDRCIEQFLAIAIASFYRAPLREARRALTSLNITHVYGSLGGLGGGRDATEFGSAALNLMDPARRIKTFSEQVDSQVSVDVSKKISRCDKIIFLGFSFADINMEFLRGAVGASREIKPVDATCFQMSPENVKAARTAVDRLFSKGYDFARFIDDKCASFFDRIALSL